MLSAVREASERQRKREQREEATRDALVMASPPPPLLRPNQSSLPTYSGREVEHPGPLKKKDRKSFYGDKWETKLFKKGVPGTLYAFFRSCWEQHRGGTAGEANSSVFADPFKTFSRQRHMFEWADDLGRGREGGERLRYFAFEVSTASGSSRRGFLATTLRRFWRHYSVMPSCSRHYYELIRENEPCSMYYDLEFSKALNEGRAESGDRIVDLVISLVSHHSPPPPKTLARTHSSMRAQTKHIQHASDPQRPLTDRFALPPTRPVTSSGRGSVSTSSREPWSSTRRRTRSGAGTSSFTWAAVRRWPPMRTPARSPPPFAPGSSRRSERAARGIGS